MKILVCIKSVIDSNIKAKINNSSTGIDIMNSKMSINPFDEVAIEAAVSLKEANLKNNINTEIIALSIGMPKSQEALKIALAHGCDRAIFVNDDTINDDFENHLKHLSPIKIATIISHIAITENPELIFLGNLAIDDEEIGRASCRERVSSPV